MTSRHKTSVYIGLAALVAAATAAGIILTRGKQEPSAPVFCGPDGRLVRSAPVQSHRSYCLRSFTSTRGLRPSIPADFRFDIIDDRGMVLRQFATVHEKIMHVIVVRHDLTQFQHLHPAFSASDGRFTVQGLVLPSAGPYRLFADFTPASAMLGPDGQPLPVTVPVDLVVGDKRSYEPQPLAQPSDSVMAGEYEVTLARPETLRAGEEARLTFTIRRGGAVVTDLQPYLGANGHAVILREGDLAFIHSHALEDRSALEAGQLPFIVHLVEPGRYRMFIQFQHRGTVQTAAFTLPPVVAAAAAPGAGEHSSH